eukprot:3289326-Amphidinium_carterae.1
MTSIFRHSHWPKHASFDTHGIILRYWNAPLPLIVAAQAWVGGLSAIINNEHQEVEPPIRGYPAHNGTHAAHQHKTTSA